MKNHRDFLGLDHRMLVDHSNNNITSERNNKFKVYFF